MKEDNPAVKSQFTEENTVEWIYLGEEGTYKYYAGDDFPMNSYPLGTDPVSPRELGQDYGYDSVLRPTDNFFKIGLPIELARRKDFHKGVLEGMRCAVYETQDLGEE